MKWQPIETAPKDGTEILLGHPDGSMVMGWWASDCASWVDDFGDDAAISWPTHWQPLPDPPVMLLPDPPAETER